VAVHYIIGGFGEIGPLLALPVFVAVLGAVSLVAVAAENAGHRSRRALLLLQAGLLATCMGVAVKFGPFANIESPMAVLVGMLAVAAMATQNALVKFALPGAPSTAVMTTNVTQFTVDLAVLAWGGRQPDTIARARHRAGQTLPCVVGFAAGCAAGAVLEVYCGLWALTLPLVLAAAAVPLGEWWPDGAAKAVPGRDTAGGRPTAGTEEPDSASEPGQPLVHGSQ
jgi:uncharacterized membrane protein YoaK (UPF0700 family)